MADSTQWEVEEAEARDLTTHPVRLAELIWKHLEAVLANPGFALLLVEQPDFWKQLKPHVMSDIARSPSCPDAFVDWMLSQNWQLSALVAALVSNPAISQERRRQALLQAVPPLSSTQREFRRLDQLLSPAELSLMERGGLVQSHGPSHWDTLTPDEFETLSSLGVMGVCLVVSHPGCPAALAERLSEHSHPFVYGPALAHPGISPDLLATNLSSPTPSRRRAAAENPAMTHTQFQSAASDARMRSGLARNPHLPRELIAQWLQDPDQSVRVGLAQNVNLPAEAQLVLAADEETFVLETLDQNPSLTAEARARLAQRKSEQ